MNKVLIELHLNYGTESFIYRVDKDAVKEIREFIEYNKDLEDVCEFIESLGGEQVEIYTDFVVRY